MVAESAQHFAALERQAQKIMAVFGAHGYEPIAPPHLQPADVFLDVIGEELRARTYVFTDPDGEELCLRPDLTVPACRLYAGRNPKSDMRARYAYHGTTFRFQPGGGDAAHPREFRQAGIENFSASNKEKAEAQVVSHTIEALEACGITDFSLRLGDLGLLQALLNAIGMPERWRQKLRQNFWRPEAFETVLNQLATGPAQITNGLPKDLIMRIDPENQRTTEQLIVEYLAAQNIDFIGVRGISEIAQSLKAAAKDANATPLPADDVDTIMKYVGVNGRAPTARARLKDLMNERGIDISDALSAFTRRLDLLSEAGVDVGKATFSAKFGPPLAYYTGFVFELQSPVLGAESPLASGGRYDGLIGQVRQSMGLSALSSPAVGAAIHTERLADVILRDTAGESE